MIESMIALGILVIGLVGTMELISRSLSANRLIADQYIASYLAAEGIEVVKNLIDANKIQGNPWDQGITTGNADKALDFETTLCPSPCPSPCSPKPKRLCPYATTNINLVYTTSSGVYDYIFTGPPPDPRYNRFKRRVTINQPASDEIQVISRVDWTTRSGATFSLEVHDHFFDWRP